ncbi:hypothetical protein AB0K09_28150 [Streptomyces sp. NPDC049577]|uniref:hypothetical protein n=1 Tax=Streptomyces sp. NPDC049577 TaxID=3155153 RepID=UPI00341ACAC1
MIRHTAAVLVDDLLAALDPLPYPRRARHVAERARELSASGELPAVLDELSRRGAYGQELAALAAGAAREAGWLRTRLTDPDPVLRRQAVTAVRRGLVPDGDVIHALQDAPVAVRRALIRAVVGGRRTALADALARPVRDRWGDAEAARLLPACSPRAVAELLPALFHAVTGWCRLARRHAPLLLDEVERRLTASADAARRGWWLTHAAADAAAAEHEPERVLGLLERLCPGPLPGHLHDRLPLLATVDAGRTLRLLLDPDRAPAGRLSPSPALLRALVRHDPPELADLARALGGQEDALARLLRRLPPSRRAACYDAATAGRETAHSMLSENLLDVLPHARRQAEARRMAARARERGEPWQTVLTYVAHLPPAQARPELAAATRRSTADERAHAYRLLLRNAARSGDPAVLNDVLAGLTRLRNEQDPVRHQALAALSRVRPALITTGAVPHLERLATDAFEARDCSHATRSALGDLARAVLREHAVTGEPEPAGWALRTLARLADAGHLWLDRPRRGQERRLLDALLPTLEARAAKADFALAVRLADALGERAHALPELQDLLARAARHGDDHTARYAVHAWLDDPRTRDERLAGLLALDPSYATLPRPARTLTLRRTDLLDAVLGDTPPYGRFLTEGSHWLPPVGPAARRLLPRQRTALARLLERAADDATLPAWQRAAAIRQAAWIPEDGTALLRRLADEPDVPVAEAALAALAATDRPGDHLPALLAHAGGDRARVALYAATRASRYVAPSELAGTLRALLLADGGVKVTSRKEAARLAATQLPVREAAALLAEACLHPGAHHDVQAAGVAFTTGLLACEEAWDLLETAATGRRELRLALFRTFPGDLPGPYRPRYAALVRTAGDTDDPELAREAHAALAQWAHWAPEAVTTLVAAVTDLENRATWRSAADALRKVAIFPGTGDPDATALVGALRTLIAADAVPGTDDAGPDRDRPARRRVRHLVDGLISGGRWRSCTVAPVVHAVAEVLAAHDDFLAEATRLLADILDLNAGALALTDELTRLAVLHEGRPALAVRTAATLATRLRSRTGDEEAYAHAARALTENGGHAAGLFAVTLTETGGHRTNWAAPWRGQLRTLRRHAHPDVRDAALAQLTAPE